ncbi:tRNA 2-selenouridine(34) synthase MnmH [Candidatus Sororendozoicomonas aggregata]|uniref:tRNA 2-selenouridine(34) synthase MnmH n=1 Tax=Candidatus Sororendozoicomonas aggregata TaxID=3073239 RepID=UPI002ED015B8
MGFDFHNIPSTAFWFALAEASGTHYPQIFSLLLPSMCIDNIDTELFLRLFLHDTPLMDVRAPVEFNKGAFPTATNLPLLDDRQREIIGTCYKQKGHDEAVNLGNTLATADIRQQRLNRWQQFIGQHPEGYLYCFRGGERSHTTQRWLKEAGIDYPLINGGYKALRHFLIESLEHTIEHCAMVVLSGKTGVGKTRLLNQLPGSIDLEGLANHRGSSFGRRVGGQPTQINFENRLAIALLKHYHNNPQQPVILEDESKMIGRCSLPPTLKAKMQVSPLLLLEESMATRVTISVQEYIIDDHHDLEQCSETSTSLDQLFENLRDSLYRIRRRLGGLRYQQMSNRLDNAIHQHRSDNDLSGYRPLIEDLLSEYYDPMYDYQLAQKESPVLFKGNSSAIEAYCQHFSALPDSP